MAVNLLDSIVRSFGPSVIDRLGQRLGISPAIVKAATPVIIGFVLSALKRVLGQEAGEEKFNSLLKTGKELVGSRGLEAFIGEADPSASASLLDILTGDNSIEQVTANFAHKSGLDPQFDPRVAGKMMGVMAPAVLDQISKFAQQHGLDVKGIANAIEANSDALASLGSFDAILDDQPGLLDDLKRGLAQLFGRG
jgi:hypothetical protein